MESTYTLKPGDLIAAGDEMGHIELAILTEINPGNFYPYLAVSTAQWNGQPARPQQWLYAEPAANYFGKWMNPDQKEEN